MGLNTGRKEGGRAEGKGVHNNGPQEELGLQVNRVTRIGVCVHCTYSVHAMSIISCHTKHEPVGRLIQDQLPKPGLRLFSFLFLIQSLAQVFSRM